eukprot:scaffold6440_cov124-Cylindrotheca_fusiformis.AAC.6
MIEDGISTEDSPLLKAHGRTSFARSVSSFLQGAIGSERQHELQKVWSAAHLVRDAFIGETDEPYDSWFDPYEKPENVYRNSCAFLCCHLEAKFVWPFTFAMWILVLLSFIEPPYWCRDLEIESDDEFGSCGVVLNARDPSDKSISYYPNFGIMLLNVKQTKIIQLICVFILFFKLLLRIGRNGFEIWRLFYPGNRYVNGLKFLMLGLLVSDKTSAFHPFFRLTLLGTYLKSCQKEMTTLIRLVRNSSVQSVCLLPEGSSTLSNATAPRSSLYHGNCGGCHRFLFIHGGTSI